MTRPTQSWFDEKLARFASGEVTAEEARELARASLESPAWFEELTATALSKAAVSTVPVPAEPARRGWWRSPFLLATAAVIVIALLVVPYGMRHTQKHSASIPSVSPQTPTTGAPTPTLAFSPASAQPILLAESLQLAIPRSTTQVFRGDEEGARAPRHTGSIISVEDGQATMNLGSTDGLMKGSQVEIFRDDALKNRVGTLRVATVFREQARVNIGGNDVKLHYVVRVTDRDHLQALLQQADDLEARGDLTGARRLAEQASEWSKPAIVTTSQRARATEVLARLDFKAKDLASAETHYRAALDLLTTDPHTSPDDLGKLQSDLAALVMLRGDYDAADKLLRENPSSSTRPNLRAERLNNLGVLAEIHRDWHQAGSFYTQALAILPQNLPNERRITEANLARVKGLH